MVEEKKEGMSLRERLIQMTPPILVRLFAKPYIAGNSLAMALEKADALYAEQGLHTTLDLLGEGIREESDIQAEVTQYLEAIEKIGSRQHITLSIKLTQLGLALDPTLCERNLRRLLDEMTPRKLPLTLDMEESHYVDATLSLYQKLRPQYPYLGAVLQSRLFRTSQDIPRYLTEKPAHIRLCLGIYKEPSEIAHQQKKAMKDNFLALLSQLWDAGHFVAIATHDEGLLEKCLKLAEEKALPPSRYEIQMLLGVPRSRIQQKLRTQGITVRLYVPYATAWKHAYAYAKRRLVENPQMALYVLGNLWQHFLNFFRKKPQIQGKP